MAAMNYGVTLGATNTNSETIHLGRLYTTRGFQRGAQMAVQGRKTTLYLGLATR